jgi:hypothetical protein
MANARLAVTEKFRFIRVPFSIAGLPAPVNDFVRRPNDGQSVRREWLLLSSDITQMMTDRRCRYFRSSGIDQRAVNGTVELDDATATA